MSTSSRKAPRCPPATRLPKRARNEHRSKIVLGKRAVTADTAVRPARYFGTTEQFWMGLQDDYELEEAHAALGNCLDTEVKRLEA
ncbi:HigA family addiction module antitoxin [Thiohalomonas denitrificans]|uniref:HigA family addiction module antitoxin n=1 Tax=Thiohalomonas denitrificans TaxID=415747 RepID=UPI003983129B